MNMNVITFIILMLNLISNNVLCDAEHQREIITRLTFIYMKTCFTAKP